MTDDPVPVSNVVCNRYYHLTCAELRYIRPFCWVRRHTSRQAARMMQAQGRSPAANHASLLSVGRFLAQHIVGTAGIPDCGRLSVKLRNWLKHFRPELVFTILGTPGYIDLLQAICREFRIPFILHVMDHGTIDPLRTGLFGPYLRWLYRKRMLELVPQAARCLAIGEAMAQEYRQLFGRPFDHFQNAIDLRRWTKQTGKQAPPRGPARLLYTGSLLPYAALYSLKHCCETVLDLNRAGYSLQLEIYTPRNLFTKEIALLPQGPEIVVKDVPASDEDYFALLHSADLLLLPVNFDPASFHYIRLSMPTKLPSYLASGVPILVYGPAGTAQVAYAKQHGWGYVVDQQQENALKRGILACLFNPHLRQELTRKALATAWRYHDALTVRARFQQTLIEAALQSIPLCMPT